VTCTHCSATVTNGMALCERCQQTLRVAIVNAAAYYADLDRIRPGSRVKVRGSYVSTPPPGTNAAPDQIAAILEAVDNTVSTWTRALIDDRPQAGPPPASTGSALGWLESHVPSIANLEWADEFMRDITTAEKTMRRLLDKSDTGWYAGKCGATLAPERPHDGFTCECSCHLGVECDLPDCAPTVTFDAVTCGRGLYGTQGVSWIRCPECGATRDAATLRDNLMREARAELAPVSVVARAVVGLLDSETSVQKLANRIDQWIHRGRLRDLGVRVLTPGGKPQRVYRIGDVFDLLGAPMVEADADEPEAC
jgi:hypothetical protein